MDTFTVCTSYLKNLFCKILTENPENLLIIDQSAFDSRLLIASIQTFLIKNHNLIELRKPLILSYTNNCISITQTMLFIKIIFSYGWETVMILYKKTFIYLKNNNENKNTMFNKTEIQKNILSFFFSKLALEMSYRYVFFT